MLGFKIEAPEGDLATVPGLFRFEADWVPVPDFFKLFSLGD
jgi:hypothetical protein